MLSLIGAQQTAESVRTIVLLFAIVSALFWKVLLRIIVTVAVIVLITLLVSGAIVLLASINGVTG